MSTLTRGFGTTIALLTLFCYQTGFSQINDQGSQAYENKDFISLMQNPDVDFSAVQKAFNQYWDGRTDYKGNGWKVFKRWEYINEFRVLPNGKLQPPGYVTETHLQALAASPRLKSASGSWSIVAPTSYPVNNTSQPTGMGRVNAIAFHPGVPSTIYVGSPSGGIWKSTGGGTSWSDISSDLPTLGVSSILIDPTDSNIIYIGSGDRDSDDAEPMGVFKSVNGGATWTQINGTMGNVVVGAMIMHPSAPNTILAATSGGIYKTTDGGASWSLRTSGNFKDIKFKPDDPSIVYAVNITTPAEFYRSTDTGGNWTKITSGISTAGIGSRMVIGVSPANSSVVYLVQIKSADKNFAGLLKSTDAGLNFSTQSTSPNIFDYACDGSGTASQATYDLCITVDPANANTLYVGSINNWKSTDGGVNWTIVSQWAGQCSGISALHADQHVYEWSGSSLYVGHDGGISYTANAGGSWTEITGNLAIAQVYKIGQSATQSDLVLMGFQDNGSAASDGSVFTTTRGGDGTECLVDYGITNYCYNTYVMGDISRSTTGPTGTYSNIGSTGTNGIGADETGAWVTPFLLHKTDANVMFAGYENVFRTANVKADPASSVSWLAISTGETTTCRVLEQSAANVDILYVARPGSLKRTDNANAAGSVSWTVCALPGGAMPVDIEAHPTNADIVFATSGYGIYRSGDKGATWSDISSNLPGLFINCIVMDKNSNEGLYIGNQTNVWYKDAGMTDWILYSSGLPPTDIRELEIYYAAVPANNRIKAGTYGRGLWQSDLAQVNVIDPSNFTANSASSSQINLSWTKNAANNDVIIAWSPTSTFGVPADGTGYTAGNTLPSGGGTVAYVGGLTSFNHSSLTSGITYYYKIWSVNGSNQYSAGLPPISETTYSHNWTGGAGTTNWFTPGNWGPNSVPTSLDGVFIPLTTFQPVIAASGAACEDVWIESGASLTMSNTTAYTLSVSGDWTNSGTFTCGIGTVNFNGSNTYQEIAGSSTTGFYILGVEKGSVDNILEANSIITLNATTPDARLQLISGTFKISNSSINIIAINTNGTATANALGSGKRIWVHNGTLAINSSWRLNAGELKITGGVVNVGNVNSQYLDFLNNGKIIVQGGELNVSAGIWGNTTSSSGTVIINGGTLTVATLYNGFNRPAFEMNSNTTFTMTGGGIVIRRHGTPDAGSDYFNQSNNATVTGGTLQIGNASTLASQTIRINSSVPVYNLVVNSTNSPTAQLVTNGLSVLNDVTISGGTLNANNLNLSVGGSWTNNGSFTAGTGTVTLNGTGVQNITGSAVTTFKNLTVNNSAGLSLIGSVDATIAGTLTLTSGVITTGGRKVIIESTGSVSRTSGHIFGNLQKNFSTGTNISQIFEIGDASAANYTPITLTFATVGTAGNLITTSIAGDHPNIGSSLLAASKSVNRYWTLTNSGIVFTNYTALFNFLAGDLDGTANTSNLICGQYAASTWSYPTVGTKTSLSTEVPGLTSLGNFQLAEPSIISSSNGGGFWDISTSWSPAIVPVAENDVVITTGNPITVGTTGVVCNNLTINASAILTINAGGTLTANGTVVNNAGNAGFLIKSTSFDALGTGSLILNTENVDATVERYLTGLVSLAPLVEKWHTISSPVADQSIPSFLSSQGIDHWTVGIVERYGFAPYLEQTNTWNYYTSATTGILGVGNGYEALIGTPTGTVRFTGKLNSANVSPVVQRTEGATFGWNLLGNPYPSGLDVAGFLTANAGKFESLFTSLYVWNGENKNWEITTTGNIPLGEGFFVKAATGVTSFIMNTGMRTHTMSPFKSALSTDPEIRLIAESAAGKSDTRIAYHPNWSRGIDEGHDIAVFNGQKSGFEIFTRLIEGSTLDIGLQGLPDDYDNLVVPVGLRATQGSKVTLRAEMGNFPATHKVYLEDKTTGQFIRLDEPGSMYSFTLTSPANGIGRFYLHTKQGSMGIDQPLIDGLSVLAYPERQLIRVLGEIALPARVSVYDLNGRIVRSVALNNPLVNEIYLPELTNGMYLLVIESAQKTVKRKISWIK